MLIHVATLEVEYIGSLFYFKNSSLELSLKPSGSPFPLRKGESRFKLPRVVEHADGFSWDGLGFELEYCRLGPRRLIKQGA